MVWYALNFDEKRGQSDLAKRIRNLALQKGGVVFNIGPEIETIHSADGCMRQYFPHDVLLEADTRCTGLVAVYKEGELQLLNTVGHLSCSTIRERKTKHILILHTPFSCVSYPLCEDMCLTTSWRCKHKMISLTCLNDGNLIFI